MIFACGFDHAGFPLKEKVLTALSDGGHEAIDLGTYSTEPVDYPDIARRVTDAIIGEQAQRGVLVCGSGAGVAVAATKVFGIFAATIHDTYTAHQAVEHDNVNVLCLGARVIGPELASEVVRTYASAQFSNEARHVRRIKKIEEIEAEFLSKGER